MRSPDRFARNLAGLLFVGALCSCNPATHKSQPSDTDQHPAGNRQAILLHDPNLAQQIVEFLALPTSAPEHAGRREELKQALKHYFGQQKLPEQLMLKFEREGMSFLLPVQILALDKTPEATPFDLAGPGQFLGTLDLKHGITRLLFRDNLLLVLLPESLNIFDLSGGQPVLVHKIDFPANSKRHIKTAYPYGIILPGYADGEYALLTSDLLFPLVINVQNGEIREAKASDWREETLQLISWSSQPGDPLNFFAEEDVKPFRDVLRIKKREVRLDEAGTIGLFDQSGELLWNSSHGWGDRLFALRKDVIVVYDTWQNAMVAFKMHDTELTLLGQSPACPGRIAAACAGELAGRRGIFVTLLSADFGGKTRLYFIAVDQLQWQLPLSLQTPAFPDFDGTLSMKLPLRYLSESLHHQELPDAVNALLFEPVVELDHNGHVLPLLADSFQMQKDATSIRIELRNGVSFSDGSQMTAASIKAGWELQWRQCLSVACPCINHWRVLTGAKDFIKGTSPELAGLRVLGPHTLVLHLSRPRPEFVEFLSHPCFSVKKKSANGAWIGTGPFRLVSYTGPLARDFICERNEFYHDGFPPLSGITVSFVDAKAIDVVDGHGVVGTVIQHPKDINYFRYIDSVKLTPLPGKPEYFLVLHCELPVRRQILASLDFMNLVQTVSQGNVRADDQLFNDIEFEATDGGHAPQEVAMPSNLLRLIYRAGDDISLELADRIAAQLAQADIPISSPQGLDKAAFDRALRTGAYDLVLDYTRPVLHSGANKYWSLLSRGYRMPAEVFSRVESALEEPENWQRIKRELDKGALIQPILSAQEYGLLPGQLKGVVYPAGQAWDFSKAWLPK